MKITRRQFVAGMGAAGGLAALGGGARYLMRANHRRNKPNIILFIADDMRSDVVGFAGNTIIKTEFLDQLAREGVVFDNHFVTTSVCPVSRASIMSGEYAVRHGVHDFSTRMRQASLKHSFPWLLKQDGYYTGYNGKWGMGGAQPVELFDHWHGYENLMRYYPRENHHITDIQTQLAIDFLKTRPSKQPFLLVVSYKVPHSPFVPQQRHAALYSDILIPRVKTDTPAAGDMVSNLIRASAGRINYAKEMASDSQHQQYIRNYYRLITGMDESVGQILQQLGKEGEAERTSIIFTSDNGLLMGEHQLAGKWNMYEESIRVPLVIRPAPAFFPDAKTGRVKKMSLNVDISPSILTMADIPIPAKIHGRSLVPLMYPPPVRWREGFYYMHPSMPQMRILPCEGYRDQQWKYARYGIGKGGSECLFSLTPDPLELANMAEDPDMQPLLQQMRDITTQQRQALLKT